MSLSNIFFLLSIKRLGGLIDLISLRELYLSDNKIKNVKEFSYLENLAYLSVLDLCYNEV
jgi:protein phosphatase 1 regulatory subunit 7